MVPTVDEVVEVSPGTVVSVPSAGAVVVATPASTAVVALEQLEHGNRECDEQKTDDEAGQQGGSGWRRGRRPWIFERRNRVVSRRCSSTRSTDRSIPVDCRMGLSGRSRCVGPPGGWPYLTGNRADASYQDWSCGDRSRCLINWVRVDEQRRVELGEHLVERGIVARRIDCPVVVSSRASRVRQGAGSS